MLKYVFFRHLQKYIASHLRVLKDSQMMQCINLLEEKNKSRQKTTYLAINVSCYLKQQ